MKIGYLGIKRGANFCTPCSFFNALFPLVLGSVRLFLFLCPSLTFALFKTGLLLPSHTVQYLLVIRNKEEEGEN